jgi:hypothetical protein
VARQESSAFSAVLGDPIPILDALILAGKSTKTKRTGSHQKLIPFPSTWTILRSSRFDIEAGEVYLRSPMGMGLPDDRREADSSYCAKALGAWSWWVLFQKPSSLQIFSMATFGLELWRVH